MSLSIAREQLAHLPQSTTVWAGARRSTNIMVQKRRHDLVLWVDDQTVRGFDVAPRGEAPEAAIQALLKCMETPLSGLPAARPAAVYLEMPTAWEREQLERLGIRVVEAPPHGLLDETFETFGEHLGDHRTYLQAARPEVVGTFFAAARDFYLDLPWNEAHDDELVRISGLSTSPIWVSVLGAGSIQYGLGIYLRARSAVSMMDGEPDQAMAAGLMSMTFDRPDEVGIDICEEIRAHEWPLAKPGRIPLLLRTEASSRRMGDREDLILVMDAMHVVRRRLLHGELTTTTPSGRPAEASWPVDIDALREIVGGLWHRNEPCPCGSGRKLKRCCG
ncbi:MAG TPA: SEC-C domain-containing protein [Candidatus Xenobia bacterium]|jgi:hypothetical protein